MTRISYIKEYIRVAKDLSLTKAARQLNLTQPAVSKHMSALEKDLGIQLLSRDTQSISLTNAGKEFLEYAEAITETYSLAQDRMRALKRSKQVEINVGGLYHGTFTRNIIQRALCKLPDTTLRFRDIDKNPRDALTDGDIDVLIQTGAPEILEDPLFQAIHLFNDCMFAAVSPNSALAPKESVTVTDLASVTVLQPTGSNLLALGSSSVPACFPRRKSVYAPNVFSFSMIELADSDALVLSKEIIENGFAPAGSLLKPLEEIEMGKYAIILSARGEKDLKALPQAFAEAVSEVTGG